MAPRVHARRTTHTTVVRSSLDERKAVLHSFYHEFHDTQKLANAMADDFTMAEDGGAKTYSKQDYLAIFGAVLKAVPDFKWGAATNAETDSDGFAIVTVTATGHHTGAPLQLPGLEPVPASGKHFCLAEEVQKVKVKGDKVQEIVVLPTKGAGPRALYAVLSGKVPASSSGAVAY
jgi:hypothetical protein